MFWDATPFSIFSSQGLCRFSRVVPGRSTTWLPKYLRPASGRPDDRLRMSGDRNRRRSHLQKPEGYRMQHQKLVVMGRRFSGEDDLFLFAGRCAKRSLFLFRLLGHSLEPLLHLLHLTAKIVDIVFLRRRFRCFVRLGGAFPLGAPRTA